MPNPVSETIVDAVLAKLAAITIANGYEYDAHVIRSRTGGVPVGEENAGVVIVVWPQAPTDAPDVAPLTQDGYRMQILITAVLHHDINDSEQGLAMARVNADIVKAFGTDYTLGDLCLNSRFIETGHGFYKDTAAAAVSKTLEVVFFTAQGDPYTAT